MSGDEQNDVDLVLERRLRADLKSLVDSTDPVLRDRLQSAAAAAARQARPVRHYRTRMAWAVGIGAAAAGVLVLTIWLPGAAPEQPRPPVADDLALLLNVDNLDLLEQMEFYRWLDREPALLEGVPASAGQRS